MKKFTNVSSLPLFVLMVLTSMLFFSSCSSNKQYFSFTPAPPAYIKKQIPLAVKSTPAETNHAETDKLIITASAATAEEIVLPEIAALTKVKTQPALASAPSINKSEKAVTEVKTRPKLTMAQKVVLHKAQKQLKKLNSNSTQAAAGPVSNRNAIALILIGLIVAVFGTFLGSLFYTLGVLILLVGLVLLVLNYV